MDILRRAGRPEILFDPANKQHREWYKQFLEDRSWGKLPIRFASKGYGITLGHIERALLDYYTDKEFKGKK